MRALGVHIAAGSVYGAGAEGPDAVLFSDPLERLELATSLAGADQLADFSARFRQEIRRVKPVSRDAGSAPLSRRGGETAAGRRKPGAQRPGVEVLFPLSSSRTSIATAIPRTC
jgi:hypothetical protein